MKIKTVKNRVMIAAGGTGGHIFPAVAIAESMKGCLPEISISFVGTDRGIEEKTIPALGWKLSIMKSSGFKGAGAAAKLMTLFHLPISVFSAMRLLLSERPSLLVCIGGYASVPVGLASWVFGIPIVLVEPNAVPGLANRLLGRFARLIFTGFDQASAYFSEAKTIKYGIPVRKDVVAAKRASFNEEGKLNVFIFGGSQGAMRLNESMIEAIPLMKDVSGRIRIMHQTGNAKASVELAEKYKAAGIDASTFVFTDKIWECYAKADLVIARSGAGTVAELAALSLPCVLVPYPFAADDHQRANAKLLSDSGGAIFVDNVDFSGAKAAMIIRDLVNRPEKLVEMKAAIERLGFSNAAQRIAEKSLEIMRY